MLRTPVLFLIFRRPDTTARVFEQIRKQRPRQLFIAGDGGRTEEEHVKCINTRNVILDMIDWECEVKTLFRDKNLGCREAVSSAISWFFEHVEQGIILEEDCLPHDSFFLYCEELLEKYKTDSRIFMISGDNFQDGRIRGDGDYYFSYIPHIWGWASWRRSWSLYKKCYEDYSNFKKNRVVKNYYNNQAIIDFWENSFESVINNNLNTWDFACTYTAFCNNLLSVLPQKNLVSNIGFGGESTHCKDSDSPTANIPAHELIIKKHPSLVYPDIEADKYTIFNYMGVRDEKVPEIGVVKYMLRHPFFLFRKKFWKIYLLNKICR